jgi:hypothetical protein
MRHSTASFRNFNRLGVTGGLNNGIGGGGFRIGGEVIMDHNIMTNKTYQRLCREVTT